MSAGLSESRLAVRRVLLPEAVEINPKTDRLKLTDDTLVSFVPMAAVGAANGSIDVSTVRPYQEVKKGYTHFRDGDVLFAKVTPCMENGKMAVARHLEGGLGFGSTEFHVLRPRDGVDSHYVYHFVSSQTFRKEAARNMTGAVGLRRVPTAFLEEAEIPLPDFDVQRRIVAEIEKQFSRLDEAVANLQRVKANLSRYKASVLKTAVEGRLVETEASIARREGRSYEAAEVCLQRALDAKRKQWNGRGKYETPLTASLKGQDDSPEGWCWATLDQLANVVRGGSPRPAGDPRYFGGLVPWITVGSITADESDYLHAVSNGLTEQGKERSRFIPTHTLLLTNSGATLGVPKISLIAGCINDGVAALLDVEYPLKLYLVQFLRTRTAAMRRFNQGAAQPNLNTSIIKATVVPLPPLVEQSRIVAEIDRCLSIVREVEAEVDANLKRAQALRQAVLVKAFTGERAD